MQPRDGTESLHTPISLEEKTTQTKPERKQGLGSQIKTEQWEGEHWREELRIITLCKHHAGEQHMLEEPSLGTQDEQAGGWPGKNRPLQSSTRQAKLRAAPAPVSSAQPCQG